ncbi:MAG: protein phosphatase CheZ, partial [Desulfonatronovibrio sp.]
SSLCQIVQEEISRSLGKALMEGEFLRSVNKDIRSGLASIYNEINGIKSSVAPGDYEQARKLFNETEDKLDFIIQSTEEASLEIMDEVESIQDLHSTLRNKITQSMGDSEEDRQELLKTCQEVEGKLLKIMTSLSFQDIASQHIKKVVTVLKSIEQVVFDIYVSSGIMMQSKDANPEKGLDEIKTDSKRKAREFKESKAFKQHDVDDLLKQFDM